MKLKHACVDAGQYGVNVSPDEYGVDGVRMIRTTDLASGNLSGPEDGVFLAGSIPSNQLLNTDDLLLSRSGTIGRCFLVPPSAEGMTFAGFLVRFRPNADVDPRFLRYSLESKPVQDQINSGAVTSTIQNFNADRYANLEIEDLAPGQQRRIADFLDDQVSRIDRIIAARRKQIEGARSIPWRGFGAAVDGVELVPLRRSIERISDGPFGSAFSSADYVDEGPAVIRLGNIGFAEFRHSELARVSYSIYERFPLAHVSTGDLLRLFVSQSAWTLSASWPECSRDRKM